MELNTQLQNPFEIIVGTYEQYLLGYKVTNVEDEYQMENTFAMHSHGASIRSISNGNRYLASAGADEAICLYDMRYRRECGKLRHHIDTINCIAFSPENSHLFTCSKDGSIAAVRCGNWQIEKHWLKAHKGFAVNTFTIHPTGKLALSTGTDGVLKTWNLIKGRQAYTINLVPKFKFDAKYIMIVKWSPNGEKYLLGVSFKIYVYLLESGGVEREIKFDSKVVCAEFLKDDLIAVGLENGHIKLCDLKTDQIIDTVAHNMRVKCIAHMNDLLVSASSSGEIKLWRYNEHSLDMLQLVNCDARIICLSLVPIYQDLERKEKEVVEDVEKKVQKKTKLRLKQEVIIDYDNANNNRQATDKKATDSQKKRLKAKLKKKTTGTEDAVKNASSDANVQHLKRKGLVGASALKKSVTLKTKRNGSSDAADETAKSREKKVSRVNEKNFCKKRKESEYASQVASPVKKVQKINNNEQSSVPSKKHKIKSVDVENAPPRKMQKKVVPESPVASKRKKKRITQTN